MDWARVQMQPDNFEIQHFLAILIDYQLLQPNRWLYKFRRASIDWLAGNVWYQEVLNAEDDTVNNFLAVNLYEFVNTGSFTQDGDLATPPTTVGPVGAWYDFGEQSWSMLDPSSALVIMHKAYAVNGDISYFFSHPNPMRCLDQQELE